MKGQKAANWFVFAVLLLTGFETWRANSVLDELEPPAPSQHDLTVYHRAVRFSINKHTEMLFGFTAATWACLAFTQWRLREEVEQLKKELDASKGPNAAEPKATH